MNDNAHAEQGTDTPSNQPDNNPSEGLDGKAATRAFLAQMRALGPTVSTLAVLCLTMPALVGFLVIGTVLVDDGWIYQSLETVPYWGAIALFGLAFALLSGSAIAPTYAMSFACGVLFGPVMVEPDTQTTWPETAYWARVAGCGIAAMTGVGLGSVIGYMWGTLFARTRVMTVIEANQRARVIRDGIRGRGSASLTWLVGLIRFPPNSPFALTNLVMSAVHVPLMPYAVGSVLGIAPRTLLAVFLGVQAGSFAALDGKSRWIVLAGTAVAVVVFLLVYHVLSKWVREALAEELTATPTPTTQPNG